MRIIIAEWPVRDNTQIAVSGDYSDLQDAIVDLECFIHEGKSQPAIVNHRLGRTIGKRQFMVFIDEDIHYLAAMCDEAMHRGQVLQQHNLN
jgi:hypothetical protein